MNVSLTSVCPRLFMIIQRVLDSHCKSNPSSIVGPSIDCDSELEFSSLNASPHASSGMACVASPCVSTYLYSTCVDGSMRTHAVKRGNVSVVVSISNPLEGRHEPNAGAFPHTTTRTPFKTRTCAADTVKTTFRGKRANSAAFILSWSASFIASSLSSCSKNARNLRRAMAQSALKAPHGLDESSESSHAFGDAGISGQSWM
mmetsp:Transcript_31047/g.50113  ORF Transcript_31047/g.50113 Transcript_31047/m.50113 type:complete len:202 (-) Transcript_31047:474-1079(-)